MHKAVLDSLLHIFVIVSAVELLGHTVDILSLGRYCQVVFQVVLLIYYPTSSVGAFSLFQHPRQYLVLSYKKILAFLLVV